MAIYRLHRKEWDHAYSVKPTYLAAQDSIEAGTPDKSCMTADLSTEQQFMSAHTQDSGDPQLHLDSPRESDVKDHTSTLANVDHSRSSSFGNGRKGVSSGLSTITTRKTKGRAKKVHITKKARTKGEEGARPEKDWWKSI